MTPFTCFSAACGVVIAADWIARSTLQTSYGYDWDVDHFMYFGQRLLAGEFHWTVEFDDKLPIVQVLFALPALSGSIIGWLLLSIAFVVFGAWSCFLLVHDVLSSDPDIPASQRQIASGAAAVSTIYLFTFMPGGIHHINPAAASAAVAALALLVRSAPATGRLSWAAFGASALCASVAIGLRPYFLHALVIVAMLLLMRRSRALHAWRGAPALSALWVLATGIFGLLVNAAPYFVLGDRSAFYAGMSMLSQDLVYQDPISIARRIWNTVCRGLEPSIVVLMFAAIAATVLAMIMLLRGEEKSPLARRMPYDILTLTLIAPMCLVIAFCGKHFWSHYLQMLAPFWGMGLGFFVALCARGAPHLEVMRSNVVWALVIAFTLTLTPALVAHAERILRGLRSNENDIRVAQVAAVLASQPSDRRDFLFLDDMRPHWALREPRRGFPHAANTEFIVEAEWWRNVEMPARFGLPTTPKDYCAALEKTGPTLVFVGGGLPNFEKNWLCLSDVYELRQTLPTGIRVYSRR